MWFVILYCVTDSVVFFFVTIHKLLIMRFCCHFSKHFIHIVQVKQCVWFYSSLDQDMK